MERRTLLKLVAGGLSASALPDLSAFGGRMPDADPAHMEPPYRLLRMLEWLASEQTAEGGWTFVPRAFVSQLAAYRDEGAFPALPEVPDTCLIVLAFLRAANTTTKGPYARRLRASRAFLEQFVVASDPKTLPLMPAKASVDGRTPFTVRIGHHVDTALALLTFLELDETGGLNPGAGNELVKKLIYKLEQNLREDGSWSDNALNAPMLGHTLCLWSLELATRRGYDVNRGIVLKAQQYAMSGAAEAAERKSSGAWLKTEDSLKPKWMRDGLDDDVPANFETYLMAGRLTILYQADLTNQWIIKQKLEKQKQSGRTTEKELQVLKQALLATKETQASLDKARDYVRTVFLKDRKNKSGSLGPVLYTSEDFLASMLIVDAMGQQPGVGEWFRPTVNRLLDYESTGNSNLSFTTRPVGCPVEQDPKRIVYFTEGKRQVVCPSGHNERDCIFSKSWCQRDRTGITAMGVSILLADTPYRQAILNAEKKPIDFIDRGRRLNVAD